VCVHQAGAHQSSTFINGNGCVQPAIGTERLMMRPPKKPTDTVKPCRKCLRRHPRREVNGHEYSILVVVVFVPCGLVAVDIKPFRDGRHRATKFRGGYPDRYAAHR